MPTVADLAVKLHGQESGVKSTFDSANKAAGGFGDTLKKVGTIAAGFVLGAGIISAPKIIGSLVGAASDMNETVSKSNTIFKSAGAEIERWANGAAKGFGQSKQQALDAAATFGNMFTQLGIGTNEAAKMSTAMVELASDFASFHNADISDVLIAQTAAFRGEYDAVQRYVPTINAAAVEQKALAMGLAATSKELTMQDKALATQALLIEGAGEAMGDYARTSDSLANRQKALAAEFDNLKTRIGQGLLPIFVTLAGFALNDVVPALTRVSSIVGDVLGPAFDAAQDKVEDLKRLFELGLTGGRIGGEFTELERAAFSLGQTLDTFFKTISAHKADLQSFAMVSFSGLVETMNALRTAGAWVIDHEAILVGALVAIGVAFAFANPAALAMKALEAAIIAVPIAVGLFTSEISTMSTGMLEMRKKADELALSFVRIAETIATLGLSELLGVSFGNFDDIQKSLKNDIAQVNDQLHNQRDRMAAVTSATEAATRSGLSLNDYLAQTFQALSVLGPGFGDTAISVGRLIEAYDGMKGRSGAALQDFPALRGVLDELGRSTDSTAGSTNGLASAMDTAASAALGLGGASGTAEAGVYAVGDGADKARGSIAQLTGQISAATSSFYAMATAAERAAAASREAFIAEQELANMNPGHATGGIFSTPHRAWIAEEGPEAILPLNDLPRSRRILAQIPELSGAQAPAATGGTSTIRESGPSRLDEMINVIVELDGDVIMRYIERRQAHTLRLAARGVR